MPPQPGCRELGGARPDTNRQRPDKLPDPTRLKSVRELKLRGSQEAGTPGGRARGRSQAPRTQERRTQLEFPQGAEADGRLAEQETRGESWHQADALLQTY